MTSVGREVEEGGEHEQCRKTNRNQGRGDDGACIVSGDDAEIIGGVALPGCPNIVEEVIEGCYNTETIALVCDHER